MARLVWAAGGLAPPASPGYVRQYSIDGSMERLAEALLKGLSGTHVALNSTGRARGEAEPRVLPRPLSPRPHD